MRFVSFRAATGATRGVQRAKGVVDSRAPARVPAASTQFDFEAVPISKLSDACALMAGDIIYSGRPENVGPVVRGVVIACHIDRLPDLIVKIVSARRARIACDVASP